MTEHDDKLREAVALFRYGLIADLVHLPRGARGMGEKLREKRADLRDPPPRAPAWGWAAKPKQCDQSSLNRDRISEESMSV